MNSFTLKKSFYNKNYNGLAILTGKINNLIVIDIDNVKHWEQLLTEQNKKEPDTVKVISGSGGRHLYFEYDEELKDITSKDHCFGPDYDIDIKTNGGCVIVPPSTYYNNNLKKDVSYEWNNQESIFDFELIKIPSWIKDLLLQKQISKKNIIHTEHKLGDIFDTIIKKKANIDMVIEKEDEDIDFAYEDIEELVNMLSLSRCEKYQDWINVGMCLYNIKKQYLQIWNKWSQKSDNYEKNICEEKWNSFKKTKDGMKIGSLLLWCKTDNKELYDTFMKQHKLNHLILNKFPNDKLILGDTVFVNNNFNYTCLKNKECLIKGDMHIDLPNSMYIEMTDKFVIIKCKHPECFGKIYPCDINIYN